ncbi:MAG: hypothetical protein AB1726_03435, partial [Planctomycetota bacterium]
ARASHAAVAAGLGLEGDDARRSILALAAGAGMGLGAFLAGAWLLGVPEWRELRDRVVRRLVR